MYSIANNAKPAILTRTESRIQSQRDKRTRDTEARRAKYRRNAARYLAASFGHFSLDSIDAEGNVRAGCHFIRYSELADIAGRLSFNPHK